MIDHGLVHAVVATGALIAHGLTESIGLVHYRNDTSLSDKALFERGYNRIYDTLEMEANLNDVEVLVREVLEEHSAEQTWSSAGLCQALGKRLSARTDSPSILRSAYQQDVPIFIPALTDSEIGLDLATWATARCQTTVARDPSAQVDVDAVFDPIPSYNPFLDLQQYARFASRADCLGIFTVGGGVPRNWAQQIGPYFDVTNARLGLDIPVPRFRYAVRICPEPVHWGGLSGCTYSEGVSWGKFVPPNEGGRFAEVHADATLVWPLLMKAVLEQCRDR
jgi:deoxyhypusine synthase